MSDDAMKVKTPVERVREVIDSQASAVGASARQILEDSNKDPFGATSVTNLALASFIRDLRAALNEGDDDDA